MPNFPQKFQPIIPASTSKWGPSTSETVELLIMNGGMNDVGMNTPVEEEGGFQYRRAPKIREVVKTRLQRLLEHAHATFPNAQIMYIGYYPALGPQSQIPLEYYQLIFLPQYCWVPSFLLSSLGSG